MKSGRYPQRLFFMIKPDGIFWESKIRDMIEPLVDVIASRYFDQVALEKIEGLYNMHKNKFFYPYLIDGLKGKPIRAYVLGEREGVRYQNSFINDFIELVGDTDPARAKPGTIRSLSTDTLEKSLSEKRAVRNLVHRSTTHEETEKEAAIFFWDYIRDRSRVEGEQGGLGKFLAREGGGVFYEERIESSLRKYNLLSFDEELINYQDLEGREEGHFKMGRAIVKILKNGSIYVRKVSLQFNVKTSFLRSAPWMDQD